MRSRFTILAGTIPALAGLMAMPAAAQDKAVVQHPRKSSAVHNRGRGHRWYVSARVFISDGPVIEITGMQSGHRRWRFLRRDVLTRHGAGHMITRSKLETA